MNTWILDAIDPLYFGDGRPVEGAAGRSRALPPPQVVAGLVRTRQGLDARGCWIGNPDTARTIPVQGPFPALLGDDGSVAEWLFPRPLDALLLEGGLRRLSPLDLGGWGAQFDAGADTLAPVGRASADPSKPVPMNALWRWSELAAWLIGASPRVTPLGIPEPALEQRTHVSIDPNTGRAEDGMLFALAGRRYVVDLPGTRASIGIGLRTSANVSAGVAAAGGERRLVRWRRSAGAELPAPPPAVLASAREGAVRVVLATPAIFAAGWRPKSLFDAPAESRLIAATVGRPDVVSGWDLAARRARPTRRCAPAGSVYFLQLGGDPSEREAWARNAWLAPRSDLQADRTDGFGAILLGTWDGKLVSPST
jgi:CRISPR-associated protein Cmr3